MKILVWEKEEETSVVGLMFSEGERMLNEIEREGKRWTNGWEFCVCSE